MAASEARSVITTVRTEHLREFLDAVHVIVDECKLEFTDAGFEISAVDPANVAMVEGRLNNDGFDDTEITGINVSQVLDTLELMGREARIEFRPEEEEFAISDEHAFTTIDTLDPDKVREQPNLPDITDQWMFQTEAEHLHRMVEHASNAGAHVGVNHEKGQDRCRVVLNGDRIRTTYQLPITEAENGQNVKSPYSRSYIEKVVESFPRDEAVTVRLKTEFPIEFQRDILAGDDTGASVGTVSYLVAPRIDDMHICELEDEQ